MLCKPQDIDRYVVGVGNRMIDVYVFNFDPGDACRVKTSIKRKPSLKGERKGGGVE